MKRWISLSLVLMLIISGSSFSFANTRGDYVKDSAVTFAESDTDGLNLRMVNAMKFATQMDLSEMEDTTEEGEEEFTEESERFALVTVFCSLGTENSVRF
ncbi:MAG TPA: hypothetical protein VJ990_00770 [Clostridia bacterium]|nr:hypothetical protein [Clostridia bacterium]